MSIDRWVLLSDTREQGIRWLTDNMIVFRTGINAIDNSKRWAIVVPIFDPTDVFDLASAHDQRAVCEHVNAREEQRHTSQIF